MTPDRSHSDAVGRVANKVTVEGGAWLLRSEISIFRRTSSARDFLFFTIHPYFSSPCPRREFEEELKPRTIFKVSKSRFEDEFFLPKWTPKLRHRCRHLSALLADARDFSPLPEHVPSLGFLRGLRAWAFENNFLRFILQKRLRRRLRSGWQGRFRRGGGTRK